MGFFSSRKDEYGHTANSAAHDDKSKVVQVIRSRFYGKSKGKEKDDTEATFSTPPSAAQALSPVARRPTAVRRPPRPTTTYETSPSPSNGRPTTLYQIDIAPQPPRASPSSQFLEPSGSRAARPLYPMSAEPPSTTDVVTVTLAQRLDELAKANSEGLLNDEEYRMLRKDLFERFASTSTVPTEPALVPTSLSTRPRAGTSTSRSSLAPSRPSSQFHVDTTRTPSVHSKGSVSSGMASFFSRRTTDTRPRSNSKDQSDVSSIFSTRSNFSNTFKLPKLLTRKTSQSSVGTEVSQSQADAVSISSRRTDRSHSDRLNHSSPRVTRSAGTSSIRRMATPPSAFPSKIGQIEHSSPTLIGVTNIFDEANLTNSQDIRKEIFVVESEKRRLMDSFNSLELRLLTQNQRRGLPGRDTAGDAASSNMSFRALDRGEGLRRRALENDSMSVRSGLSTSPSIARSTVSWKARSVRTGTGPPSISESLHRKNSKRTLEEIPPMPALPSTVSGFLGVPTNHSVHSSASPSSISADNSSFLTLDTLPEDAPSLAEEMADIKQRREEVAARYDARLEYLQAKLKGAQLHEKLLRK